jgi:hypothetical protein
LKHNKFQHGAQDCVIQAHLEQGQQKVQGVKTVQNSESKGFLPSEKGTGQNVHGVGLVRDVFLAQRSTKAVCWLIKEH